jgi:hypothetical protein
VPKNWRSEREGLETRLRELIKSARRFAPNRGVPLLRESADPSISMPFSPETKNWDTDIAWFGRILENCGTYPRDLEPRCPGVLWFSDGRDLFWVIDSRRINPELRGCSTCHEMPR